MKKVLLGLLYVGLTLPMYAQISETTKTEALSEVTVKATNYRYLQNVKTEQAASVPVKLLERKVAEFDVKDLGYYQDDYDFYEVTFYIPAGTILAAYDKDGVLLRTVERFDNVNLPSTVRRAVAKRFPGWSITKDAFIVDYHEHKGVTKKYKLKLENGDKRLRVKLNETGDFL